MAPRWHPWPVDLSDDLPPPRRPLFFPVVIATIFLTIIGMSAGLALGARHKHLVEAGQSQPGAAPTSISTSATTPQNCRPETQAVAPQYGAVGQLKIALLLRTKTSAVWICRDEAGRLFYHANRGGENAKWVEKETALFLTGVHPDGEGFEVTATDGTTFSITAQRLRIVHRDGTVETQEASP
jgi:hypothetical protein